ncbi:hypothetical protein IWX49DRAFT_370043 [Phyllosticta citricarpa]
MEVVCHISIQPGQDVIGPLGMDSPKALGKIRSYTYRETAEIGRWCGSGLVGWLVGGPEGLLPFRLAWAGRRHAPDLSCSSASFDPHAAIPASTATLCSSSSVVGRWWCMSCSWAVEYMHSALLAHGPCFPATVGRLRPRLSINARSVCTAFPWTDCSSSLALNRVRAGTSSFKTLSLALSSPCRYPSRRRFHLRPAWIVRASPDRGPSTIFELPTATTDESTLADCVASLAESWRSSAGRPLRHPCLRIRHICQWRWTSLCPCQKKKKLVVLYLQNPVCRDCNDVTVRNIYFLSCCAWAGAYS